VHISFVKSTNLDRKFHYPNLPSQHCAVHLFWMLT
jgi:hypothetical protein